MASSDTPDSAAAPWRPRFAPHLGIRSPAQPMFEHSARSNDPVDQIRYAADLGFRAIFDNGLKLRSREDQERIGKELARLGMAMGSFVSNLDLAARTPWHLRDRETRASIRREIEASVAVAHRVNGRVISIVSAVDETQPHEAQLQAMADNLKDVATLAQDGGIVLALEPVSSLRVPGLLLRHVREAEQIVREVDSPAVGIVFDTHHVRAMDGDVEAGFARVADLVAAVQLADFPERHEPGTGTIAFDRFLRQLEAARYGGLIELEFFCAGPGAAGEQAALDSLRSLQSPYIQL